MRLERPGLRDAGAYEPFLVGDVAILARIDQVADRVLEIRAGLHQTIRQIEHFLEPPVAYRQLQVAVIDRQSLCDKVQSGGRQRLDLVIGIVQSGSSVLHG